MIKAAIEKILELAPPEVLKFYGLDYTSKGVVLVKRPLPEPLETETLSSLTDYIDAEVDGYDRERIFIHIENHGLVSIKRHLDDTGQRATLVRASLPKMQAMSVFGTYWDVENFIIKIKTFFVETDASKLVIQLIGNIRDESVKKVHDDGISQKITTSTGVASIGEVVLPNPVILKPYRTFFEVDQPSSPFLLRMKQGKDGEMPSCALFEADGGMWRKEAVDNIRNYFEESLPSMTLLS